MPMMRLWSRPMTANLMEYLGFVCGLAATVTSWVTWGAASKPSAATGNPAINPAGRSEEHTSELQSLRHLVCRLLLEKKKTDRKEKRAKEAKQPVHVTTRFCK